MCSSDLAAAVIRGSKVLLKNILLNKTRIEAFEILKKMGCKVEYMPKNNKYEESGDILIEHRELKSIKVDRNISWLIDELPALGIVMAFASGESIVENAKELRVKESDRIKSLITGLKAMGCVCEEKEDGYTIYGNGGENLKSAKINSFGDHRVAMSFAIAGKSVV